MKPVNGDLSLIIKIPTLAVLAFVISHFKVFITVEPPVSDHPKCKDLVVADRRLSLRRIELKGEGGHLPRTGLGTSLLYGRYF